MELPLFPLHTVLCPGVALPLHVFEERYRAMVARCLRDDSPFGIVLIRDGREVGGGPASIAAVGTVAEIREANRFSDGRYELLVVGTRRFRIESVAVGREPYLVGTVELLDDPVGETEAARDLTDRVTQRFVRYLGLLQPAEGEDADDVDVQVELELELDPDDPDDSADPAEPMAPDDERRLADDRDRLDEVVRRVAIPDDPTILSYLLSGIIQVDQPRHQELLETPTTEARLGELLRLIDREIALLERRLRSFTVDPRQAALRRN
jgi:Lon protease-like protein